MKAITLIPFLFACISPVSAEETLKITVEKVTPVVAKPKVQLALLLDTSSSMDGLIDQARTQLWKVVNSFSQVTRDGQTPTIEVALYEYGNDTLSLTSGYVRQVSPLSTELDDLSEKLFALQTNGGTELCGTVIQKALDQLCWDDSPSTYKAIFIAGNESFRQGNVSANEQCKLASEHGVIVNTIHCGSERDGISGGWQAGALIAKGDFLTIDQDQAIAHIVAPQDKLIIELSTQLNSTYIPYGQVGKQKKENQAAQDNNAYRERSKGAAVGRAITKSSKVYNNASWDMLDFVEESPAGLAKLQKSDLPSELKELTLTEQKAYIEKKREERTELQNRINTLNKEREAYIAQQKKVQSSKPSTLDQAITKTIHRQVQQSGYSVQ